MKIAIVTFDGFNEIDSFVALNILNRVKSEDWQAEIVAPTETVTSINGVTIHAQKPLSFANEADAVLVGSGRLTRKVVQDERIMSQLALNPEKQLIGSQCSGALILKKLGLVENMPVCTDKVYRPLLEESGATVLDQPFFADGNIASAAGCLASPYLAAWFILRGLGREAAVEALTYVAPNGEEAMFINHILESVAKYIAPNYSDLVLQK